MTAPTKLANAPPPAATRVQLGPISTTEVYPLDVFKKLAGLDKHAMRTARRAGLPVRKVGKRAYVRGCDFAAFLAAADTESSDTAT